MIKNLSNRCLYPVYVLALMLPFNGVIALKRLALLSIIVCVVVHMGRQQSVIDHRFKLIMGFLAPLTVLGLYVLGVSVPLSTQWFDSLRNWYSDQFIPWCAMLALLVLLTRQRDPVGAVRQVLWTLVFGFCIACVLTLVALNLSHDARPEVLYHWVHGAGQFSTVIGWMTPVIAYLWLTTPPATDHNRLTSARLVLMLAITLQFVMASVTLVRMFWIANLVVVLVILLGVYRLRQPLGVSHRALMYGALVALVLHTAGYWLVGATKPVSYLDRSLSQSDPARPNNAQLEAEAYNSGEFEPVLSGVLVAQGPAATGQVGSDMPLPVQIETLVHNERYEIWAFWWKRILERPWFGYGFGLATPPNAVRSQMPSYWPVLFGAHAHNRIINLLAQLGFVGFSVWLLAQLWLMKACARVYQNSGAVAMGLEQQTAALMCMALWVAHLVKNMTDDYFSRNPVFIFWFVFAIFSATWLGTLSTPADHKATA